MFEKASRMKLRFTELGGSVAVEDLWDLSLSRLNTLAKALNKLLKESEEEDFLKTRDSKDTELELKFKIVLHILETKKEEKEAREQKASKKAEKERLLAILERKQDEALEGLTAEELQKRIAEL